MKKQVYTRVLLPVALIVAFFACSKSKTTPTEEVKNQPDTPQPVALTLCPNAPDYGSAVLCTKWMGPNKDYIVDVKNNPGSGKYFAWPAGLVIDSSTGAINVTQSEAGARYKIGFLKDGATDTCFSQIIIGGVTYLDGVYVLSNNDTLAIPYFDANPVLTSLCDDSGNDDYPGNSGNVGNHGGDDRCEFDDDNDDDNGNGPADEPPAGQSANSQKVRVRTISGIIDLKKTLEDGAFGDNPQNGASKEVTIYYRLNDCSQKALRKIKVRLTYYEKKSDIPVEQVQDVEAKRSQFMQSTYLSTYYYKPRPPQIFVTRIY
jgi:hypothetical protein